MAEPFVAQIQTFAFDFAPVNWALCNGQLMSITQNTALFSLIGTTYGGDGVTTFALPNLQSRTMIHQGTGPGLPTYVMGEASGSTTVTLLTSNLPAHNHALLASSSGATSDNPSHNFLAQSALPDLNPVNVYGPAANATMNPQAVGMTGSSIPISILQPFLTINVCICLYGIFPSRG